ncbi:MAG: ZIP family metal transporter [Bacteroidales bacterium]
MEFTNLSYALTLTIFAGLSTGIGSLIAFFAHKTNKSLLAFSLGLSAGVMIYISFVELFNQSQIHLVDLYGDKLDVIYAVISLFAGIGIIAIADLLIPSYENPHELRKIDDMELPHHHLKRKKLKRMGLFTALAIALHNFPEGVATFITAYENPSLGIAVAIAVAIHNIPEGIAIAVPIYYATNNKRGLLKIEF